jgi:hypothetical protein
VFSQARRLDRVEATARDAIAIFLDVAKDDFVLSVREKLGRDAEQAVSAAIEARSAAAAGQQIASMKSREAAQVLAGMGLPHRDIGRLLDLSHQRVGQLLAGGTRTASSPRGHGRTRRTG